MRILRPIFVSIVCVLATRSLSAAENATRLKELITIEGVRDNQLMGYGVVVGLKGTGDRQQTVFSAQSLANLLERMGLTVSPTGIQVKNTAVAMVTATLPAYGQAGARIDVTVSAMGDAPSLVGGVLLMTNLHAPDGQTYAVAQGPMVIGGFSVQANGTSATQNHPTVGRIPNGAIIERSAPTLDLHDEIKLQLTRSDFATASRVVAVLNQHFGPVAQALNAGVIDVKLPEQFQKRTIDFVAELEALTVQTDRVAAIVVNERTGTIIMGKDVQIAPVAIMQSNLNVEIQTVTAVSQPNALSQGGATQTTQQSAVNAKQEPSRNLILKQGATVEELVRALSSIGSSPRDIISILQNLKDAGALEADLKVI